MDLAVQTQALLEWHLEVSQTPRSILESIGT